MVTKTYGTVSAGHQKAMSGFEFVQGLVSGALPLNTFAKTLGYDLVEAENGRGVITVVPTSDHLNPWGTVHGGLTATLLDTRSSRRSTTASAARHSNSKSRSCKRSRRRQA